MNDDPRTTPRRAASMAAPLLAAAVLTACASQGMQVQSGQDGLEADRVPAGTEMEVELEDRLSIADSEEDQEFHATVDEALRRPGGVVVPEGSLIHGRITAIHRSQGDDDPNILKLHFYRIDIRGQSYPLSAELTDANPETDTGDAFLKAGAGAAAGAVLGRILGGDVASTVAGAAVGAAAGTAVALTTKQEEAVLARGSKMRLELQEAIELEE